MSTVPDRGGTVPGFVHMARLAAALHLLGMPGICTAAIPWVCKPFCKYRW